MNMVTRMIVMVVVWIIDLIRYKTPTQSRKKEAVQHEVFTERVIGANDEHRTSVRDVTEYTHLFTFPVGCNVGYLSRPVARDD